MILVTTHKAFNIPYIYDYITKLWRHQAEVIQNHENINVRDIKKTKPGTENKRLELVGGHAYGRSSD
jgi:hypothetical protein